MRKMLVVAMREYKAAVKTKSFFVSIILLPIMMGGGVIMQRLLRGQIDTKPKHFAVVDRTHGQTLARTLEEAVKLRNTTTIFNPKTKAQVAPEFILAVVSPSTNDAGDIAKQRFELSEQVRKGELQGFLDIDAKAFEPSPPSPLADMDTLEDLAMMLPSRIRYQTNNAAQNSFTQWAGPILRDAILETRFSKADSHLGGEKLKEMIRPERIQTKGLMTRDPITGEIVDSKNDSAAASILIPAGLMILLFMMILVGATPLMQGVVEEKMQRIAEVLLGSLTPFQMMMGKLIGMAAVSITLTIIYLSAAYWAANRYGFTEMIPPSLLGWFFVYLILGLFMFGSLFIAVGSACTDMRETQSMMWPVMLLAMMPLFAWINVLREPNSTFSTLFSLFPFATPMLMLLRQAVPPGIPAWQPILGVGLMILTTLGCVFVASRIFRVGILMQGKGAQPSELIKWIFRG